MAGVVLFAAVATLLIMRFGGPAAREAGVASVGLVVLGLLIALSGRAVVGVPIAMLGLFLWYRNRPTRGRGTSEVRSAWLAMRLDHATDTMDGTVLRGRFEGRRLEQLSNGELRELADEVAASADADSAQLLEAYLDRRMPGWRDGADGDGGAGLGVPPRTGPMSEQEAYDVLGLAPGAGEAEIREAHRRLMKRAHPDAGGSAGLAARVNEAKDVLLRAHG